MNCDDGPIPQLPHRPEPFREPRSATAATEILALEARGATPARLFVGRAGTAYPTRVALRLRADHAAARDAVNARVDLAADFPPEWSARHRLFELQTAAVTRSQYLLRPDLGRKLSAESRTRLMEIAREEHPAGSDAAGPDLQVVLGDGLSAMAVREQAPAVVDRLEREAARRGWSWGRPFLVGNCRVGLLNEIGELLRPVVAVLLIGERPGLATALSLSAYMAYRPGPGQTDADRNLISNIHAGGIPPEDAAVRIADYAAALRAAGRGGVAVKEPPLRHAARLGE